MTCPGSVRLIATVPASEDSEHAKEGTAAHGLAERCLRQWLDPAGDGVLLAAKHFVGDTCPETGLQYTHDMAQAVQVYLDWVFDKFGAWVAAGEVTMLVEERVSLEALGAEAEGMFGTADLLVYHAPSRHAWSCDYKHGKGVTVEIVNNTQTKYYAVGVQLKLRQPVDKTTTVIIQPRKDHEDGPIREHTVDTVDLVEFSIELLDAARATRDPGAPLVPGPHCRDTFCDARPVCQAHQQWLFREAQLEFSDGGDVLVPTTPLEEVPPARLVQVLAMKPALEAYLSAVEQYLHARLENGEDVTDGAMKLVEKRAVRKWNDADSRVTETLQNEFGLDRDDIVLEKLASPAQVEKLLPKELRGKLNELTVKESSGTTLVMASDKRPAITPGGAAAEFDRIED